MHEVKAALQANNWDLDVALEALQRQGLTAASKKVCHCT
jgi:translation elongation factor EF-Ts